MRACGGGHGGTLSRGNRFGLKKFKYTFCAELRVVFNAQAEGTRRFAHIGFAARKCSNNARAGAGWKVGTIWPARRIVAKLKSPGE